MALIALWRPPAPTGASSARSSGATPAKPVPERAQEPVPPLRAPARAAVAPSSSLLAVARPYAPWNEPPPPLRGVTGLVRDAFTRRPIEGAWITWRLPPPSVAEQVLRDGGFRDPRFTMMSDARGRFAVDRLPHDLPLSSTVFVVARGYAYAAVQVGATREHTIDLVPMGTLEVLVRGSGTPAVVLRAQGQHELLRHLPTWGGRPGLFRIPFLVPGAYTVQLDPGADGPTTTVEVRAGQVARVELRRRPQQRLEGTLAIGGRLLSEGELVAVHTRTYARTRFSVDRSGRFGVDLFAGRYALFVLEGATERRVPGVLEPGTGSTALEVESPPGELRLRLRRAGAPARSEALGLVQLDAPLSSLIAPRSTETVGLYVAAGWPGRYAIFDGSTYLGEATLPGELTLDLSPRTLQVRVGLGGLQPEEIVRGTIGLIPSAVLRARPDLGARFDQAREPFQVSPGRATLSLPLGPPGRYRLAGSSELGEFAQELTLSEPSGTVVRDLQLEGG